MPKLKLIAIGTLLTLGLTGISYATTPTLQASIVNNTGEPLYVTIGALPDQKHLSRQNSMLCPIFAPKKNTQQVLDWNLKPGSYQLTMFTAKAGSPSTPKAQQNSLCYSACNSPGQPACHAANKYAKPPQKALPPVGPVYPPGATPISCSNQTIKFATMNPGILTFSLNSDGGLVCTLNQYQYTSQPIPYRQLNVGQNYLPPLNDAKIKGVRPTRTTALINLQAYLNNKNGPTPLPLKYTVTGLSADLINIVSYDSSTGTVVQTNQNALLQINKNQIFVQHNIGPDSMATDKNTYSKLYAQYNCNTSGETSESSTSGAFCTPYYNPKTKEAVKNKFVLWPTISTVMKVYKAAPTIPTPDPLPPCFNPNSPDPNHNAAGFCSTSQTFPIVISNALRAKTVTELVDPRMLWLMANTTDIKEDPITQNPYQSWQNKNAKDFLWPDGADSFTAQPEDFLAVAMTPSEFSTVNIGLNHYFVKPHNISSSPTTYSFDASYLQVSPGATANYMGTSTVKPTSTPAPIVLINRIGIPTKIPCSSPTNTACTTAGPFQISNGNLTLQKKPANGVYQINVKATNTSTENSAYTTFYVYVSNAKNATMYSSTSKNTPGWLQGGIPNFNILNYGDGKKFGTAYLYTSNDFTKNYSGKPGGRIDWVKNISTLLKDIGIANSTYHANIKNAFVDVNNLSFTGIKGYWPVDTATSNYRAGNVAGGILPKQMQTNLTNSSGVGEFKYMLKPLQTAIANTAGLGSNPNVSLTVYPSNNLKANFAGFNAEQRQIFADMSMIPALNSSVINGISVDLEGGLNSVGNIQFYKLLADKLAYQGKWFSYFYFVSIATPAFSEALGPLGALEVSTYDVGTYRAPGKVTAKGPTGNDHPQQVVPGTVPLQEMKSVWKQTDINNLYTAFSKDKRCNDFAFPKNDAPGPYVLTIHSWCNNSPDMSYSENNRLWTGLIQANGYMYGTPIENLKYFNGKFHLILPVSWSATQFTKSIIFGPDLGENAQGLFMANVDARALTTPTNNTGKFKFTTACIAATAELNSNQAVISPNANACLFGGTSGEEVVGGIPVQDLSLNTNLHKANVPHIVISSLPGSAKNSDNTDWTDVGRRTQADYLYTNFGLYQDLNSQLNANNLVGVGAYALENFENVPAGVKSITQGFTGTNASMQLPWYVGFTPKPITGTQFMPGYNNSDSSKPLYIPAIWNAFGNIANKIGQ